MNRWTAGALHLTISASIAAVVLAAMMFFWFPPPYFKAMGGPLLAVLLVGCDAVLGPLLTLIVFKSDKKSLRLDLAVIGLLQALALMYGCGIMFAARPAYTIFVVDRFEVVAANEVNVTPGATPLDAQFQTAPLNGPRVIGAVMPKDWNERSALMMSAINGGADAKNLARLYVPYDQVATIAAAKANPISVLANKLFDDKAHANLVTYHTAPMATIGFLPLKARNESLTVVLERPSGRILDILRIDPW